MNNLQSSQQAFFNFLNRFHLVIFIVAVMLSLSIAVILLYGIVGKASGIDSTAIGANSNKFDQNVIDRIEQLKTVNEPSTPLDFSGGRINPFSE